MKGRNGNNNNDRVTLHFAEFYNWSLNNVYSLVPYPGDWPSRLRLQITQTASLQRGKTSPTSMPDMTLNNLIVRLQLG